MGTTGIIVGVVVVVALLAGVCGVVYWMFHVRNRGASTGFSSLGSMFSKSSERGTRFAALE